MPSLTKVICKECNKPFDIETKLLVYAKKKGISRGEFCSRNCKASYYNKLNSTLAEQEAVENPLKWNRDISYLIGLVATDGNLGKGKPYIRFVSADIGLVNQVKEIVEKYIVGFNYKIVKSVKGKYTWYSYKFTSRKFYNLCLSVGLMPNKSCNLKELHVPSEFFSDFLRGVIDGNGCLYIQTQDNLLILSICSGSYDNLFWLKEKVNNLLNLQSKGNITKENDSNTYQFTWGLKDTLRICEYIYNEPKYFLERKKNIVDNYISNNADRLSAYVYQ